jgi:hypothetical protein
MDLQAKANSDGTGDYAWEREEWGIARIGTLKKFNLFSQYRRADEIAVLVNQ